MNKTHLFFSFLCCAILLSCNKTNAGKDEPTPPVSTSAKLVFYMTTCLDQLEKVDQEFTVAVMKDTFRFKSTDMTEYPDTSSLKSLSSSIRRVCTMFSLRRDSTKIFKYDLGMIAKGDSVTGVSGKIVPKVGVAPFSTFDYFVGFEVTVDGKEKGNLSTSLHRSVEYAHINDFSNILFKRGIPLNGDKNYYKYE